MLVITKLLHVAFTSPERGVKSDCGGNGPSWWYPVTLEEAGFNQFEAIPLKYLSLMNFNYVATSTSWISFSYIDHWFSYLYNTWDVSNDTSHIHSFIYSLCTQATNIHTTWLSSYSVCSYIIYIIIERCQYTYHLYLSCTVHYKQMYIYTCVKKLQNNI